MVARHRVSNPSGKPIKSFAWCSKHAMVATCGVERHIDWWSPAIPQPVVTLYGHAAAVEQVLMDDTNHQLLSRDTAGCVRVWDVRTHRCVQVIEPTRGQTIALMAHDASNNCLLTAG